MLDGVTVGTLMRETMPQLRFVLRHQGRILWPRLQPQVEANFQPSDEGVDQIIRHYRIRQVGGNPPRTPQEERRELAWRIVTARYTGEPVEEGVAEKPVEPIRGLSREAAAAVLAWAASPDCPEDIHTRDVAPLLRGLRATAERG